jgi:kynureninase
LVFVSHVFFNSGHAVDLQKLSSLIPAGPILVIDGYHGFCALPTDLSHVHQRAFYMSGGYKYAMAGEGACFLHVPENAPNRPINTGWFAAFGNLQEKLGNEIPYAKNGARFFGATFDPCGLYRFNASMQWRNSLNIDTHGTRVRAHALQKHFLAQKHKTLLSQIPLLETNSRGLFLTFRTPKAQYLCDELKKKNIAVDARGENLRFGFGLYIDEGDVDELARRISNG